MLDITGLNPAETILFADFYNKVSKKYDVEIDDDVEIPLNKLALFRNYNSYAYQQSIRIKEGSENAFITILQVEYSTTGVRYSRHSVLEFQVWSFCFLPKKFGNIVIRPETFRDKLIEFFQPLEMNFPDDHEFCDNFYVLAKDQQKAQALFNSKFREEVKSLQLKSFSIEILEDFLIMGTNKSLGNEDTIALAEFAFRASEIKY
jgi:hypothetical protein